MQPYVIVIIVIIVIMFVVGIIFSIIAGQANYRSVYGLEHGTMKPSFISSSDMPFPESQPKVVFST